MEYKVEQIALCPRDPVAAMNLLSEIGMKEWAKDIVVANGKVFGDEGSNVAQLSFNYTALQGARELEVLHYTDGKNWMAEPSRVNSVSHLGMHCSAEELVEWRAFFAERGIDVAQEVLTESHTNPVIAGKRWYNYVIFDTKEILGVDLKFIVRKEQAPS